MGDDRSADGQVDATAALRADLDDLKSTVMARLMRRPTGDIEPTVRSTAKPDTLVLIGQAVSRATYPALWQWVQDNDLVTAGMFTAGDGSTTFVLPDMRGRVPIGVGTLGTDVYALGAKGGSARHTLVTAEMPSHEHTPTNGQMATNGAHSKHFPTNDFMTQAGADYGLAAWNSAGTSFGDHNHQFSLDILPTGGGGAHENRQPYIAINWLIWT